MAHGLSCCMACGQMDCQIQELLTKGKKTHSSSQPMQRMALGTVLLSGELEVKLSSPPGFKHTVKFSFVGSFCGQGHELSLVKGKEEYKQKWVGHLPLFRLSASLLWT